MANQTKRNGRSNGHAKIAGARSRGIAAGEGATRGEALESPPGDARLPVLKTYKVYVGGKFPRSESGRAYVARNSAGKAIANVCLCSRKDVRDAVVAARAAQSSWASRSAYNRGQILYRIAEMLEGRAAQFVEELSAGGVPDSVGTKEVRTSIDRLLHYAGWADKYQQIFSSVNPVASSHFNFSVLEPTGVVSILAPQDSPLLGLISVIAPAIVGGNSTVVLASTDQPIPSVTLGEVLATSDLPGGVVNLLTGQLDELHDHFASHMDINACVYCGNDRKILTTLRTRAAANVKRVVHIKNRDWFADDAQSPYFILDTQEVKTTWHPVGT